MNVGDVERVVKLGHECLDDILAEYRWASAVGHGSSRGDVVVSGGDGDPTAGVVTAAYKARVRRAVGRCEEDLGEVVAQLRALRYTMDRVLKDREGDPSVVGPALVTRAELAAAVEAKLRRESRGEGWGDG